MTDKVVFQELTISDYDRLIPFWKTNYFVNEMDSLEKFKLFLKKNPGLSIIAKENGKIIGTALGSFDGRRGYIQKLVVDKNYRKKGLGQQLVQEVIKKLRSAGASYIPVSVEENIVPFYEKCGFKKTCQIPMNVNI